MATETLVKSKILDIKKLTENVIEIKFEKPANFEFTAGQFIRVQIPNENEKIFRSYSICSTPNDKYLELCIKLLPTGKGSSYFQNLKKNDEIFISQPLGRFTCQNELNILGIATGVGITPIYSIISNELVNKGNRNSIILLFGVRSEDDLFWLGKFADLKNRFNNFNYFITLSAPKSKNNFLQGRVTDHLKFIKTENFNCFICGNMEMVKDVRELLIQKGVDQKNIHLEIF